MKYGLEKEYFLIKRDQGIQILGKDPYKDIPYDQSGCLVEARGKPMDNIEEAVYMLKAEEHKILSKISKIGSDLLLVDDPLKDVTRDFKREVRRLHAKGNLRFQNMYGYKDNRHKQNQITAAVHISFTNPQEYSVYDTSMNNRFMRKDTHNCFFDFIKYVRALDSAFKTEIKQAKRNPGFYEVKHDGRVEYRSLPSNVNLDKIISVINDIK